MVPIFISLPYSPDELHKIAAKFENRSNYPNALEVINCKHVIIKNAANCGSFYCNYKKKNSVILMAVAGPNYKCFSLDENHLVTVSSQY